MARGPKRLGTTALVDIIDVNYSLSNTLMMSNDEFTECYILKPINIRIHSYILYTRISDCFLFLLLTRKVKVIKVQKSLTKSSDDINETGKVNDHISSILIFHQQRNEQCSRPTQLRTSVLRSLSNWLLKLIICLYSFLLKFYLLYKNCNILCKYPKH